ncbi:MAG: hypothetical protein Q8J92_00390 [Parvibaculum sp.]|uniref:hypothetical protein n=1 Tax=Parvibaculum sp. TaxID=2024848 RepID=UPI0027239BB7|nr:hypothetical protein [Parvibaculum sp.]MDO8838692.1 hypothetical protein [Parvibaculum sp.]MDP2122813.1 hypothetical protein [Parvibaculum sp.]
MTLYRVHMTLARNEDHPNGSPAHGYDLVVPLDASMKLDPVAWKEHAKECVVRRFWQGEPDEKGLLRHIGRGWAIDYDLSTPEADEPFFKLDRHEFKSGEYLSVAERDGEMQTFRIVTVEPLKG